MQQNPEDQPPWRASAHCRWAYILSTHCTAWRLIKLIGVFVGSACVEPKSLYQKGDEGCWDCTAAAQCDWVVEAGVGACLAQEGHQIFVLLSLVGVLGGVVQVRAVAHFNDMDSELSCYVQVVDV